MARHKRSFAFLKKVFFLTEGKGLDPWLGRILKNPKILIPCHCFVRVGVFTKTHGFLSLVTRIFP
jgi:hypothetical protein